MIQDWFANAKLGIFVHWGVYAVGRRGSESWPLFRGRVGYDEYLSEMQGFTASAYDADAWAELIARSGANYAVLTTKHHDGVALWPTKQFIPVHPPKGPWELCMTTNNTWSYTGREENYKTPYEIILMFCECLGMGGNLLLNIGPDELGIVPPQQVALLEILGAWVRKHAEAVYGTMRGLPHGYAYGFSSLGKDRETLFLYLTQFPKGGAPIKGIHNDIKRVTVLGTDFVCPTKRMGGARWLGVPGTLWIDVPAEAEDAYATVLKIELEGPLNLYDGKGVEIDAN